MSHPEFVILTLGAAVCAALGGILTRASRPEGLGVAALGCLLVAGAGNAVGLLQLTYFASSLIAGLLVAAALHVAERAVPRWLAPAAVAYGCVRAVAFSAGLPALADALALAIEPTALVYAALLVYHPSGGRPGASTHLGALGMAVLAVAEGFDHVAGLFRPGYIPWLPWIAMGFSGFSLLAVSSVQKSRELARRAQRELQQSLVRFDAIANSAYDLIVELDARFRVAWVSPSVLSVLGWRREDLLGRAGLSFIHREDRGRVMRALGHLSPGDSAVLTAVRTPQRDGEWRWMEGAARAFVGRSGRPGIVVVARDVTERIAVEESLRTARKQESLALLAGGIAHDFNNALMGILGSVDELRDRAGPGSELRPLCAEIEAAADRATQLTDQLLAYAGRGELRPQPLDLSELADEMARLMGRTFPDDVSLECKLADGVPIHGDGARLRQALLALLTNAREALGSGGGRIKLATGVMELDADRLLCLELGEELAPGAYAYLEVSDDGPGMDAETRDRLFDPFFTTREQGRGLGMANVLGLARSHRGAIEVTTAPGRGTRIRIFFPEAESEALPLDVRSVASVDPEWRGHGTLLVVDDEQPILRLARRTLQARGFDVLLAHDGREAVEIFRRHADEIRAVVMDVMMPEMRGDEAFLAMRRYDPDVRVVFSSGWSMDECLDRIPEDAIAGFLPKPYRHEALVAAVRDALEDADPQTGS